MNNNESIKAVTVQEVTETKTNVINTYNNKEYISKSEQIVTRYTTQKLAELVLATPGTMFTFATTPNDMYKNDDIDSELGEKQSEQCLQDMINGLNCFNELYGIEPDMRKLRTSKTLKA